MVHLSVLLSIRDRDALIEPSVAYREMMRSDFGAVEMFGKIAMRVL
jgi:hypothetical protein